MFLIHANKLEFRSEKIKWFKKRYFLLFKKSKVAYLLLTIFIKKIRNFRVSVNNVLKYEFPIYLNV